MARQKNFSDKSNNKTRIEITVSPTLQMHFSKFKRNKESATCKLITTGELIIILKTLNFLQTVLLNFPHFIRQ